ncbi:MAG: hypothetical protein CMH55_09260 [Myxococcales bacterium]|nr:hypothetical protein [Myxococcales bacterium]
MITVFGRELRGYFRSPMGWVIAAAVLFIDGLLFNGFAVGSGKRLSSEVVHDFFYFSSGTTMIAGLLLSMRLFAEELQVGTQVLLRTAPLSDWAVILGKFFAAFVYLALITLATLPMLLLVDLHGQLGPGHLVAGYTGLLLIAAASVAIGTLASAVADNQVVAAILGAAILVSLLLCWLLARVTEPPISDLLSHLSFFDKHFTAFMEGEVRTPDVAYYLSVTWVCLLIASGVQRMRRWR